MPKDIPKYCPFCGADIKRNGHDDDCRRPKFVQIHIWWSGDDPEMMYQM